ncbi:MAG: acyl-CoA thioesterase [Bdellovibrionales bacterium]
MSEDFQGQGRDQCQDQGHTFSYERRVAFVDTDAMGVVHHANYLHYCEEARVAWMRDRGLAETHYPHTDHVLAVLHYQVWHRRPCTFDDRIRIDLQVRREGMKIHFQYTIVKSEELLAQAETLHIPLDGNLRPVRPSLELVHALEKEPWTETWLSNS